MKELPGRAGEEDAGETLGNEPLGKPSAGGFVGADGGTYTRPPIDGKYGTDSAGRERKRVSRAVMTDLPAALERISAKSLRMLEELVSLPVARVSDARLRAMVTGSGIVLGTKVRVDEGALRVKHDNDVLDRLERLIREAKRTVPQAETLLAAPQKESKD